MDTPITAAGAPAQPPGRGHFHLVRYFSITALACMLAIAMLLAVFNQRQALHALTDLAEHQNITLTQTFRNYLWEHFGPLVADSRGRDATSLQGDPRLPALRRMVVDTMQDTGAVKVKIYNLDGVTVFSTDLHQVGETQRRNRGFLGAARGEITSELTHRDSFDAFDEVIADRDLFSSYLPVRDGEGRVVGVFELYRDVTQLVRTMERTSLEVVFWVVCAMLALYALLALIVRRAQAIMDQQAAAVRDSLHQVQESNRLLDQRVQDRTVELSAVNRAMENEIRERIAAERRLEHLAHHDPLTGLPNRILLHERIDLAIARGRRGQGRFALLFIDLDNFKGVNDTFGHPAGDALLRTVAGALGASLRGTDTLARLGGDEFVLVAEVDGHAPAGTLADKVLEIFRRPYRVADVDLYLGATIGISLYPADGEDAHTLIRNADTAMYHAKTGGRDRFQLYTPAMTVSVEERLRLDGQLRRALAGGELHLAFQPQVDPRSGRMAGCEALLRWQHPTQGEIPPARFVPVAEESGFISQLGEWVLRTACQEMRRWLDCGFDLPRIAVNVSARQLERNDFVDRVVAILEETGLPAERLELEITETTIMKNGNAAALLGRLAAIGVTLAIDDFGTGYSSLSHLKRLPIHKLKIDRSFVLNLRRDSSDEAIIRSVIALARSMRLTTLAEGVESPAQAEVLLREGCDQIQGHLYAEPLAADELMVRWARQGQGDAMREVKALFGD